jgi:uncharacterized protein with GYD domain
MPAAGDAALVEELDGPGMEKLLERSKAATSRPACVVRRQLAFSALLWSPDGKRISYERPQDRSAAVRPAIENLGGRIERFWLCFGEYDVVGIVEMPNNVSAAAFAIAVGAGRACRALKTTPLLTMEEGVEAMKQAGNCGYKPATAAGRK